MNRKSDILGFNLFLGTLQEHCLRWSNTCSEPFQENYTFIAQVKRVAPLWD